MNGIWITGLSRIGIFLENIYSGLEKMVLKQQLKFVLRITLFNHLIRHLLKVIGLDWEMS